METRHIIVFDGVCNFCNGAVNFIIKRDPKGLFAFAPMQSETGAKLIDVHNAQSVGHDTFLLIKSGTLYYRTDAALEIARDLTGLWFIFLFFKIVPAAFRDYFYRAFARNRYALFGKKEVCMIPTESIKRRFLE
jgi:predicted DCC family thiol-disulfide oxidoreductase YuxK